MKEGGIRLIVNFEVLGTKFSRLRSYPLAYSPHATHAGSRPLDLLKQVAKWNEYQSNYSAALPLYSNNGEPAAVFAK